MLPPVLRASLALLPSPEAQRAREVCSGWRAAVPAARYTRVPGSAVSGLEPDFHILWMTVLPDGHVSNRKGYHVKAHNTRALWRDDLTQELVDLTMVERSDKVWRCCMEAGQRSASSFHGAAMGAAAAAAAAAEIVAHTTGLRAAPA